MRYYCRGCDREFEVAEVKREHLVEMVDGKRHYHPKVDTDPVDEQASQPLQG